MNLLFGKLVLLDYVDRRLVPRYPAADTFSLVAALLRGATGCRASTEPPRPTGSMRADGTALLVAWDVRDPFDGEDEPAVEVGLPWNVAERDALDAFGAPVRSTVDGSLVTFG